MKIAGIIAEFNPFHNGHKFLIDFAKSKGATHVIAVMSGNFVQRGEGAIIDKHKRAEIACLNGCDMVLELPLPYSIASAELFAKGAVSLLNSLKLVDFLVFGSESGDIKMLEKCAEIAQIMKNDDNVKSFLASGENYPSAVYKSVKNRFGKESADVFSSPNNTLAIEYIKSVQNFNSSMKCVTVKRQFSAHDSQSPNQSSGFASGSFLRKKILENCDLGEIKSYFPNNGFEILAKTIEKNSVSDFNLFKEIVKYKAFTEKNVFKEVPDCDNGLGQRFINACERGNSIEEILLEVKSKNFTLARVRRAVLNIILGLKKCDFDYSPPYARILAFNEKSREIISEIRNYFPINMSLNALSQVNSICKKFAEFDKKATDIYTLSLKSQERKNEFSQFVSLLNCER